MSRIRRLFVLTLCCIFVCTGSVYAAENDAEEAQQVYLEENENEVTKEIVPEEEDVSPEEELLITEEPQEAADLPVEEQEEPMENVPDTELPAQQDDTADTEEIPEGTDGAASEPAAEVSDQDPAVEGETVQTPEEVSEEKPDVTGEDKDITLIEAETEETKESVKKADAQAISASISVVDSNTNTGRFEFAVKGLESVKNISKVNLVIWHAADKSDKKTYVASKKSDGSYRATMYKYLHQDHTGVYEVRARVTLSDGSTQVVASMTVTADDPDPKFSYAAVDSGYKFTTKYIRNASQITSVQYAVWSDKNGQDDIQWYTTSIDKKTTTAAMTIDMAKHADAGLFNVHVYANYTNGNKELILGTTFNRIIQGQLSASSFSVSTDKPAGKFTMKLKNVYSPTAIKSVTIAVWCRDDKSDKVWYDAADKGNGSYSVTGNVKKHSYHRGTYHAKAFVVGKNGKKTQIGEEKTFKMIMSSSGFSISTSDQIKFKVILKNALIPGGIQKMQFAVWSNTGGQDDIVWYTASGENGGNYSAVVNIKNHKHLGTYHVHAYAVNAAGTKVCMLTDTFTVMPKVDYKLTTSGTADANGKFNAVVTVTKTSSPIKLMKFEVWCKSGKSDLHWYRVTGDSNGVYKAVINTANHYGSRGTYNINVNIVFENGLEVPLTSTTQFFKPKAYLKVPVSDGTYVRRIKYVNPSVSSVKFKVASVRGGSSDSKTYTAKKDSNGTFYADVRMADFKYDGKYNIEVYNGGTKLDTGSFIMLDYLEEAYSFAYNDSIGYSQMHRCLNPDVDCSSLVHYALLNNGYNVNSTGTTWPLTTYDEPTRLRSAGFSMVTYTNVSDLQAGDILLRDGHTEIYAGHGTTVGAHGDENNDIYGWSTGDQTGHEVCVDRLAENWLYYFRLRTYTTA